MTLIAIYAWATTAALVAFVYSQILCDSGMILNPWYNWLDLKIGPESLNSRPWLFKPLGGCCRCVAGQFGFWGYIWLVVQNSQELALVWDSYSLIRHIAFTCIAVFSVKFISQAYHWNP